MQSDWIWMNGQFIPWDEATIHVTAHALHYGSSVFEGIRAYDTENGTAIFRLQDHTKRLARGCKIARLELPYSEEELNSAIIEIVQKNEHNSCYIRPLVYRGAGKLGVDGRQNPVEVVIFSFEWGAYLGAEALEQGVDVQVTSWQRMAPNTLAALAKIGGQYVNSQFITMEAHDNGFTEGIALDVNGYVSEGAGENIFVIIDDVIYTPGAWSSILLGITRDSALTILRDLNYPIHFEPIAREMLYMADEIFFTGTAAEITPVRSVDRIPVGQGRPGPITKSVQKEFFAITSGKKPDQYGWLTSVSQTQAVDEN